jgi:hypothetical protein
MKWCGFMMNRTVGVLGLLRCASHVVPLTTYNLTFACLCTDRLPKDKFYEELNDLFASYVVSPDRFARMCLRPARYSFAQQQDAQESNGAVL